MDLTKSPENIILIFSHSLDLEVLSEVCINFLSLRNSVEHLGLGERARGVNVEIVFDLLLGVSTGHTVLEEPEFGDEIMIVQISVWIHTESFLWLVPLTGEPQEKLVLKLGSAVVSSSEGSCVNWVLHPALSEKWVVIGQLFLERSHS